MSSGNSDPTFPTLFPSISYLTYRELFPDTLSRQQNQAGYSQIPTSLVSLSAEDMQHGQDAIENQNHPQTQFRALTPESHSPSDAALPQKPRTRPVDFRSLEYVGSYDQNLMCAICHCPFVAPVKLDCDHFFCQNCISLALMHQENDAKCCPTCRRKTSQISIVPVPKIINRMLDELLVRCPAQNEGCAEELPRGTVQDHVDRYCSFSEVECPSDKCLLTVKRADAGKKRCLHNTVRCRYCDLLLMERDLESHESMHCCLRQASCPHCATEVLYPDLLEHVKSCPEAIMHCAAAPYGCDFTSTNASMNQHTATCPLAKLVPFLNLQNERLAAHESALNHIRRKNSLLESSFATIQETVNAPSSLFDTNLALPNQSPEGETHFDSTAHHLLSLHDSLREEVTRVSAAVSELDAKASMMVLNESLRMKEQLSRTNTAVSRLRYQLELHMSIGPQGRPRQVMTGGGGVGSGGSGGGSRGVGLGKTVGPQVRRMSDSARQDTKL